MVPQVILPLEYVGRLLEHFIIIGVLKAKLPQGLEHGLLLWFKCFAWYLGHKFLFIIMHNLIGVCLGRRVVFLEVLYEEVRIDEHLILLIGHFLVGEVEPVIGLG